ncbi:hypothetical protein B9T39_01975 [Alloscardovia macacae]|uniref:Uncharacterized protein n=2 Tax=Alloscardovia macacae TaxID=1160091 RepID=A0A1Y2SZJ1_9BIFI|nr:hypothetical protein B9T39_01975 [Alloscardovia macacae]
MKMKLPADKHLTLLGETVLTVDPTLIITWDPLIQLNIEGTDARTAYAALTQTSTSGGVVEQTDTLQFPRINAEPPAVTREMPVLRTRRWAISHIHEAHERTRK